MDPERIALVVSSRRARDEAQAHLLNFQLLAAIFG
jgi:hypothetical protein